MSKLKAKPPAETSQGHAKGVLFGASGVGKTWFSLEFPSVYYIDTEGGASLGHYQRRLAESGGAYFGVSDGALDFGAVIGQVAALATEKHGYKTLVVDSITKLYQACIASEQERLGDKDAFGASKKPAVANMRKLCNWLSRLDMNVWLIAHEAAEWGEVNGQRTEVGKIPDVWDKLVYELDLSLRVVRVGKTYPPQAIVHKSRLTGFALSDRFALDFAEFSTRYGRDYITAAPKQITLASADQVAEIVRLADLLKITEEERDKILTRASASAWGELTDEQAAKTIKFFESKIKGEK
jgi:hypothetical protein